MGKRGVGMIEDIWLSREAGWGRICLRRWPGAKMGGRPFYLCAHKINCQDPPSTETGLTWDLGLPAADRTGTINGGGARAFFSVDDTVCRVSVRTGDGSRPRGEQLKRGQRKGRSRRLNLSVEPMVKTRRIS